MVEKNMCDVCGSGDGRCGNCGNMCGYRGNHLLRWLLGIIIITWIFSIGVKFGEIKAYMGQDGYGNHMYRAMPMMGATALSEGANFTVSSMAAPTMVKAGSVQVIKSN